MRHGNKSNHLGRKRGHRKALLKNLAVALITHKRINTTLAKAKALRTFLEPIITKAKDNTQHSRRTVFAILGNKYAVTELFDSIAAKIADRPGGYLRVIKTGTRLGDSAETGLIEFVDYNTSYTAGKIEAKASKSRRGRRGGKTGASDAATTAAVATAATAAATPIADIAKEEEE
jgi:large subunit ribosomal protein L17